MAFSLKKLRLLLSGGLGGDFFVNSLGEAALLAGGSVSVHGAALGGLVDQALGPALHLKGVVLRFGLS